jgi:protease I
VKTVLETKEMNMGKVACVLSNGFEDSEFREPVDALEEAGHEVEIIGAEKNQMLAGKKGKERVAVTRGIDEARPEVYAALLVPGGHSPDQLRADPRFVAFTRAFAGLGRPLFAICHGAQLLMTAGLIGPGRTLTAWPTVQGDLKYTGAEVKDEPVVIDDSWVTSRGPADLPRFCQAIVERLALEEHRSAHSSSEPSSISI